MRVTQLFVLINNQSICLSIVIPIMDIKFSCSLTRMNSRLTIYQVGRKVYLVGVLGARYVENKLVMNI